MSSREQPDFGTMLGRFRAALGLTQEELAERAGLSVEAISALERGTRTRPRRTTIGRLTEALQLAPDDRGAFEHAARAEDGALPAAGPLSVGRFLGALPTGDLIGRDLECERLRSLLDAVSEGRGHVLLLSGEAGIGKTRLLQELMVEARARDHTVVTARCLQSEQKTPYSCIRDVLSGLNAGSLPAVRGNAERGWQHLQRSLDGANADSQNARRGSVPQHEIFAAVSDLVLQAAGPRPLTILLDDLQWADADSLTLLDHVARSTRASTVLIAAAFRGLPLPESHPELAEALQIFGHDGLAERLTVRSLSLEETTQLVAVTMGEEEVSEEFASFVHRRTKGVPRLIDQLIRSMGGRLELESEIGAGAMGRVFRAFDRTTGRTVAAKLVLARQGIDLDTLHRFQQEVAALATLDHPHIVHIYDSFAEEHASCIIMELLDGQSLGHVVRGGPVPLDRARDLAGQVADGLAYAHSQGIVHRDIKPDNIMVLKNEQIKVTDFGIARILQPDTSLQTIATTGMHIGTPHYMAPEQIMGRSADGRADTYALGVVLYQLVTGCLPFDGKDALTIAFRHVHEAPVAPRQRMPDLPEDWEALILTALAKDPAQRFQTAAEMEEAIARLGGVGPPSHDGPGAHVRLPLAVRASPPTSSGQVTAAQEDVGVPPRRRGLSRRWKAGVSAAAASLILLMAGTVVLGDRLGAHGADRAPSLPSGSAVTGSEAGPRGPGLGQFAGPSGIAIDPKGNVWVADIGNARLQRLSPDGVPMNEIGSYGASLGQFNTPDDLAVTTHGSIWVDDRDNFRVERVSPSGGGDLALPDAGSVAVDPSGNLYVADLRHGQVSGYAPNKKLPGSWNIPGVSVQPYTYPAGIAVDAHGHLYVADRGHNRVLVMAPGYPNPASQVQVMLPTMILGPAPHRYAFNAPSDVALDRAGNIYIADTGNNRIVKFSHRGRLLATWGSPGSGLGQFDQPSSLAVDAQGNVYVTDFFNSRVQKFSPAGKPIWATNGSKPIRAR